MSTPDQRHAEKMRARAEGRAPVVLQPVVVPAGASVDERYRAKLANRKAAKAASAPEAKPESKAEPNGKADVDQATRKAAEAAELAALEEATKPEAKPESKAIKPSK